MTGTPPGGLAVALNDLVALAARLSGLPIAFVRLDSADADPQVVGVGIPGPVDDPALARRMRTAPGLLTISDLAEDPEFDRGPLAAAGVRFLAACTLPGVAGTVPGVLCVADTRPRHPNDALLERVWVLAEHIARLLAVPHRLATLAAGSQVAGARAGDGVGELRSDRETGDVILSPGAQQMLGVGTERMSRDDAVTFFLPEGEVEASRLGAAIMAGEQPAPWQAPVTARDGRIRWLEYHLAIQPRPDEQPLIHAVLLDLTERRLLESLADELSARELAQADLEHLLDHLAVATAHMSPSGVILRVNRALTELLGVPAEELVGTVAFPAERWPQREREQALRSFEAAAAGERTQFEARATLAAGERIVNCVTSPVIRPGGAVSHIVVNFFDLTDQRRAERLQTIEESYRQLQAVMDGAPSGIYAKDREGRYVFVNRAATENLGLPTEEIIGKRVPDLAGYEDFEAVSAQDRRVLERGETVEDEISVPGPDGVWKHYSIQKFPLRAAGEIHAVCGIVTDIGERKAIDAERRRRSEHQRLIGALASEVATGLQGAELAEQAAAAARTGLRGAVGVDVAAELGSGAVATVARAGTEGAAPDAPPRALELANAAIDSGTPQRASDGTAVPVLGHAGPTGALVVLSEAQADHDESDLHFLEEIARLLSIARSRERAAALESELEQAHRMESIGKLAGGVAHDFNNLLAVILNYASFVGEGLHPDQDHLRADLAEITSAAERAADLTHQLLLFGREARATREECRPNDVISGLAERLQSLLAARVELSVSLDPAVNAVFMSADETEQVVLALVLNARDAITGEGSVRIETRLDSDQVSIVVSDNGHGMPPEVLERAFEPFFTTRPPGQISGLGLATVHGIVRRAGGRIDIESSEGGGTTVRLELPHVVRTVLAEPPPLVAPQGVATILVVDDQAPVREVARRILESGGYRVLVAGGPQDARAIATSGEEQIDLLLTDVVMPGESGVDLAASLDSQPVLFMSGYADEVLSAGGLASGAQLLEKPFSKASLLQAVESALTAGSRTGG